MSTGSAQNLAVYGGSRELHTDVRASLLASRCLLIVSIFSSHMDLADDDVRQLPEADRLGVDPLIEVEMATWSNAGQLDWWVRERREWWGRVRGANGRQRWIRAVDLRRASGSQP